MIYQQKNSIRLNCVSQDFLFASQKSSIPFVAIFFKNFPKVFMDKETGLLWANLEMFPYKISKFGSSDYTLSEIEKVIEDYNFDIGEFRLPTYSEIRKAVKNRTFPFDEKNSGCINIKGASYWWCLYNNQKVSKDITDYGENNSYYTSAGYLLLCSQKHSM